MSRHILLVSAIILVPGLSACLGGDPYAIDLGFPNSGDRLFFLGGDGTSVSVELAGKAARTDGNQETHDVLVLEYRIRPANMTDVEIVVEESVDLESGAHVRHDVLCDVEDHESGPSCSGPFNEVFFLSYGLPGGLGLAPYWGKRIHEGRLSIRLDGPLVSGDVTMIARPASHDGRRCLDIRPDGSPVQAMGAWMPITSTFAPRVVCDGDAFPVSWVPDRSLPVRYSPVGRPVFTLVERRAVAAAYPLGDSTGMPRADRVAVAGSLAILTRAEPLGGFDAWTAHEVAIERDADYAAYFKGPAPGEVAAAKFTSGGGSYSQFGLKREDYYDWTLFAARPDDAAYGVLVRKTVHTDALAGTTVTYSVSAADPDGEEVFVPSDPDGLRGFDAGLPYLYGEALFARQPNATLHLFSTRDKIGGPRVALDDRFFSRTFYILEEDQAACTGVCAFIPRIVETDSKSGWITYVQLPASLRLSA